MKPKQVHTILRVIDYAMFPFMRLVSMAPLESPQESHAWHAQKFSDIDIRSIAPEKCVVLEGNDASAIKNGSGPLFHIPIIGGWRNYVVLEVESGVDVWHVGWIVRNAKNRNILRAELHKLPLYDTHIRMLVGPPERETTFCGFDSRGNQVQLRYVGKGQMGDGSEYRTIRLL